MNFAEYQERALETISDIMSLIFTCILLWIIITGLTDWQKTKKLERQNAEAAERFWKRIDNPRPGDQIIITREGTDPDE